jgi:DNA-directed RNA polymerase specialized sigma24 family protein
VIRNAISFVMGAESEPVVEAKVGVANGSMTVGRDEALDVIAGPESILSLPELDRLVFVICVLERYSLHDCALLLGRSIREINEAQQRVCNLTGPFDEPSDMSQHLAVR